MEISRELAAYGLIAAIFAIGVPWLLVAVIRRRREKFRRRGIKTYGH